MIGLGQFASQVLVRAAKGEGIPKGNRDRVDVEGERNEGEH